MPDSALINLLRSPARPRLLVVGDLILDRYVFGDAERISQEAPIVVLRAQSRRSLLGGAANVCNMLVGLECQVTCAGVVGGDDDGRSVRRLLDRQGTDCSLLLMDSTRPTTVKERLVGRAAGRHANQMLRVDYESREPLSNTLQQRLVDAVIPRIAGLDAVLISDYDKGVCTREILSQLIGEARRAGVPVLVDPRRGGDYGRYRGATLLKPNRAEAAEATGMKIAARDDVLAAGRRLCADLDLEMAVITLDRDGMALVHQNGFAEIMPTAAREVYDITGAGDMVLAALGTFLAGGAEPAEAVRLANAAAGIEVQREGVAVVTREELLAALQPGPHGLGKIVERGGAESLGRRLRAQGKKTVLTNGCFDLLHVGHLAVLEEAAKLGDTLIVAVNSDAGVRRLKGAGRPVIGEQARAQMLAGLACVDHVIVFPEDTPNALLLALRPDVLVKGGTYAPEEVVGHEIVKGYGGQVHVTRVVEGISTTSILSGLAEKAA